VEVATVAIDGVWWRQVPHAADPFVRADPPGDDRALAELAIPPDRQMPRDLWRGEVDVDEVADLSSAEKLAAIDLPAPRPTRREWPSFQGVGEGLWREAVPVSWRQARPGRPARSSASSAPLKSSPASHRSGRRRRTVIRRRGQPA
jgi:hypothetical protein